MNTIQTQDNIYTYASPQGFTGQCRLRLYRDVPDGARLIVVVTEPVDADGAYINSGPSITAAAKTLATSLRHAGIPFTAYIEHYPARGYNLYERQQRGVPPDMAECFDWVQFAWDGERYCSPHWTHLTRAEVERLIGLPLSEAGLSVGQYHESDSSA